MPTLATKGIYAVTSPRLEATVELEVSPELRNLVSIQLQDYAALQLAIKELEANADAIKAEVVATFSDAGQLAALDSGVNVEGYGKVKMVYGTSTKLDPKKLIAQGITVAQIERATKHTPNKPYVKLSPLAPKRKNSE